MKNNTFRKLTQCLYVDHYYYNCFLASIFTIFFILSIFKFSVPALIISGFLTLYYGFRVSEYLLHKET
jgi:hypothetical protein